MKNQALTTLIIKILVLLIMIVMMFMIISFLYSVRFWPDVYNYMNAEITIKRIPKLSEIEVLVDPEDFTTDDGFLTTDTNEYTTHTFDIYIDYDSEFGEIDAQRVRRTVIMDNDYSEVPRESVIDYSFIIDDTTTTYYKEDGRLEKNLKDVEVFGEINDNERGIRNQVQKQCYFNGSNNDITRSVFPWIAAIFVKNDSVGRFDYVCDGAILSDRIILTAAQCFTRKSTKIVPDDLIVILGKRSLLTMTAEEKVFKVSGIRLHDNFTKEKENGCDLAILRTDEAIVFKNEIQPACLTTENDTEEFIQDSAEIATTGWAISGELTSIRFDKEKSKLCQKEAVSDDAFCANYSNDVRTCPSYGGIFVAKAADGVWRMRGLRTGDQSQTGFCFNTGVLYTDLLRYSKWILGNI